MRDAGRGALADLGFIGLDTDADDPVVITGRKAARNKPLTPADKQVNQLISAERAPVEHGFADLKSWRILTKRPHGRHPGHHAATRPARPDPQPDHPVTDDHPP